MGGMKRLKTSYVISFILVFLTVGMVVAPGADADEGPIKLGLATPLSPPGDYAAGTINLRTANLAINHMNAEGGALGRDFKLVVGDDKGKPSVGINVVKKLITQDKVSSILGVWHASVATAQAKIADRYQVPLLAHYSWPDDLTAEHSNYVFRVSPYNSEIAKLLVPFLKQQGYDKVAVLAESTDYGIGFSDALKRLAEKEGIEVVKKMFPMKATDLKPQLSELKRMSPQPDLLIVSTVYQAMYLAPKQADEIGLTPETEVMAGWDYPGWSPEWWPTVGKAGVGVMYPTFFSRKLQLTEKGKEFKEAYTGKFNESPPIYAYFLYDEFMIVKEAIERAGSSDPQEIAKALEKTDYAGTTGRVTFEKKQEEGSPVWNQWLGHQLFVVKYTEEGQKQENAPIIYPED